MTLNAEPGTISLDDVISTEVLHTRYFKGTEYTIVRVSEGWEPAGSMMRHTDGYVAVRFYSNNARQGRHVPSLKDGIVLLDSWEQRYNDEQAMPCSCCGHPMSEHDRYKCPV